jgi:hypothetical protein
MSVATGSQAGSIGHKAIAHAERVKRDGVSKAAIKEAARDIADDIGDGDVSLEDDELHEMGQMGAKRIGSLAIGIAVVGIVLNEMSALDIVGNSTGVVDVSSIFNIAGSGLQLLVIGVIIAAAAVLLSLWSGF